MIDYARNEHLAILRLSAPPVGAISFALLDDLRAALARAAGEADVRGIVITGSPQHFSAGADLGIFQGLRSGDDAVHTSRVFQEAFQQIEDCPKPVVAAVAGNVLGGALELAMACHGRVAAAGSRFSMPEVQLGINPGAGGTQRLPRLIGLEAALEMLLGGRPISAQQALDCGLIDAVCPPEELIGASAALLAGWPSPDARRTSRRQDKLGDRLANNTMLAKAAARAAATRPELIAPQKIVEAVRAGVEESFAAGLRAEQISFRDCMATRAAQNKIYVFCASRQTGRLPEGEAAAPRRITEAAVLGMGTMGAGIAQALISAGIRTVACDQNPAALEAARARIGESLARRAEQGKLSAAQAAAAMARLVTTADVQQVAGAQVVIEAVFEDQGVKQAAIAAVEATCPAETIVATNTSTINLDRLADGMQHPERLVGLHFFHPAQQMPLVEVVRRPATRPEVVATALGLGKAIGKTPVLVNNREGFVVNRLFIPYLKEAFWLLEEGAAAEAIDIAMTDFGFAMGPLRLIDMSGLDILVMTEGILRRAFPQHGELSSIATQLVARGHLGQKTGAGVYRYESGDRTPRPHAAAAEIIAAAQRQAGGQRPPAAEAIAERLVLRMAAEAFQLLDEAVVQRPADVDVALVLGAGLADFRGGVLRWAGDRGLDRVLAELQQLSRQCGPRYAPAPLLQRAARDPHLLTL